MRKLDLPPTKPPRTVAPGDRVWLKYSDVEKARYIRKHGKGLAWRHAFTVLSVKPHAVLLDIPTDGSVPDVLPWQSLRKCSFAAPFFHDPELPLPDVDEHALPLMPEVRHALPTEFPILPGPTNVDATLPIDDDPDGWHTWNANTLYDVESIVGAEPSGRGWKVHVKWVGYPTITTERLSSIVSRVSDPRLLKEIEDHKAKYREQYPTDQLGMQPPSPCQYHQDRHLHECNLGDQVGSSPFSSLQPMSMERPLTCSAMHAQPFALGLASPYRLFANWKTYPGSESSCYCGLEGVMIRLYPFHITEPDYREHAFRYRKHSLPLIVVHWSYSVWRGSPGH